MAFPWEARFVRLVWLLFVCLVGVCVFVCLVPVALVVLWVGDWLIFAGV